MSLRTKVLGLVDIMMRVPPIVMIDEILKISMGLPTRFYPATTHSGAKAINATDADAASALASSTTMDNLHDKPSELFNAAINNASNFVNSTLEKAFNNISAGAAQGGMLSGSLNVIMDEFAQDTKISEMLSITSVKFIICLLGFLCAASIFMLWTRHLVMVYMFIISFGLTFLSYWSNVSGLTLAEKTPCILEELISLNTTRVFDAAGVTMSLMPHLVAQWFLGTLFACIHLGPRYDALQKAMPLIFTSPILCAMMPIPQKILNVTPAIAGIIPLMLSKITLMTSAMEASKTVYNGYQYAMNFISNFGLSALVENEWQRLNVPSVLRVFWTIRITQELISMMISDGIENMYLMPTMRELLVNGCETLTAVLGMTAVISIICHYIGNAFQWYLLSLDSNEEKSLGTVAAVLFYVLAIQTGLTSLPPEKRYVRLGRNVCLLLTALLHFLHNIVSSILMSLAAARNPSRKRHLRALSVCAFLVVVPTCLLIYLWTNQSPSTWLLAVTAFSVEVIIKVMVSLSTYALFLWDARRQTFWDKLDDYLYYVRAFGNSVEFFFGILLFFNGAWILLFESGGAIRAIMMCIHAYFNLWCEAKEGWSVFIKRRSAVHKISALPEATAEQLTAFDDVCAICYQQMYSAKITRCRHYFHGVCLRKWLYVQDRCPLCHENLVYIDVEDITRHVQDAPPLQIYPREDGNPQEAQQQMSGRSATPPINTSTQIASNAVEMPTSTANTSTPLASSNPVISPSTAAATINSTSNASSATTAAAAAVATAAASNTANITTIVADVAVQQ